MQRNNYRRIHFEFIEYILKLEKSNIFFSFVLEQHCSSHYSETFSNNSELYLFDD
jgi:hypothetical protein